MCNALEPHFSSQGWFPTSYALCLVFHVPLWVVCKLGLKLIWVVSVISTLPFASKFPGESQIDSITQYWKFQQALVRVLHNLNTFTGVNHSVRAAKDMIINCLKGVKPPGVSQLTESIRAMDNAAELFRKLPRDADIEAA